MALVEVVKFCLLAVVAAVVVVGLVVVVAAVVVLVDTITQHQAFFRQELGL